MDYKLAKELKDAGFVQREEVDYPGYCGENYGVISNDIYKPTLTELIDACGEEGAGFKLSWKPEFKNWKAVLYHQGKATEGNGATPEEAVARLWLFLKEPTPN